MTGAGFKTGEHPLLTVRLVVDIHRLIETVIIQEEGKVFDERDALLDVFLVFHDAHRDVRLYLQQFGARRGTDDHRSGVACITVSKQGRVEVEYAHEEGREHLVMIDGAQ